MARKKQMNDEPEIVFCRAVSCQSYLGNGRCKIVQPPNGDDKISIDKTGRCENYFSKKEI